MSNVDTTVGCSNLSVLNFTNFMNFKIQSQSLAYDNTAVYWACVLAAVPYFGTGDRMVL